ncbi:MAG: signal peptidase I [Desulfobulbus propionicus]|nr:MAG: signal peptidase I [Desulfobulbus propionicus]
MMSKRQRNFFFPVIDRLFVLRLVVVVILCVVVFRYLLIPLRIRGQSMEPTYTDRSFAFCWRLHYVFSEIQRFDVVAVRFAGRKVMLLKRVVALPGETVAFHRGVLFVNAKPLDEPYVVFPSDWELKERTVAAGHVYVIGDNRGTAMAAHRFGQVSVERIVGGVFP